MSGPVFSIHDAGGAACWSRECEKMCWVWAREGMVENLTIRPTKDLTPFFFADSSGPPQALRQERPHGGFYWRYEKVLQRCATSGSDATNSRYAPPQQMWGCTLMGIC
ncbi:hypothetical protein GGTG_01636 [Gaeumannomyces tritici R3-111a-1]|uniref:Uncharacterized protein n=1 Tax=Gaeumannomyces tritici (strain R3-111a-1) TaxID=644352 RepID=J3NK54_GAET3|nr:hypothetical protein GGTG_01636 [Gaeumannomyces tritici R3-111a-1]EJT81658.1 hypothetical protein GGTG_01636 [Gaeumannomyces tritici R3-111a-1]